MMWIFLKNDLRPVLRPPDPRTRSDPSSPSTPPKVYWSSPRGAQIYVMELSRGSAEFLSLCGAQGLSVGTHSQLGVGFCSKEAAATHRGSACLSVTGDVAH